MAFSNYDELQTAIANWAVDLDSSANIQEFISFAESDIAPFIKHYLTEKTVVIETVNNRFNIPVDFLEAHVIVIDGKLAKPMSPYGGSLVNGAVGYTRTGGTYLCLPVQDTPRSVELTYYSRFTPLSPSEPVNWLLANFPMVYLHASLIHAFRWSEDKDREANSVQALNAAMAGIEASHKRSTGAGSGNQIVSTGKGMF